MNLKRRYGMNVKLSFRKPAKQPRLPGSLTAAADQLADAIDVYAAEYGQHHPSGVSEEDARRVYATLATITRHLNILRGNSSAVAS